MSSAWAAFWCARTVVERTETALFKTSSASAWGNSAMTNEPS
ncbi:hypothetical protein ACFRR7_18840 [Streptomyces sp. NPDC056909]